MTRPLHLLIPRQSGWMEPSQPDAAEEEEEYLERRCVFLNNPRISAITVSATSSARLASTWTSRNPRSEAKAESTARSVEPRQRTSCHGRRRRCTARGRNVREWRRMTEADSILPSERRERGTCSTVATPDRLSCSMELSSMQFR